MSTQTPDTSAAKSSEKTESSGLSIGLIVGGVIFALIFVGVIIYMFKKRQSGLNLGAPTSGAPTSANGLGTMNMGTNAVPRTTMNVNAGRIRV
jgi:flagellar biogenesis protein FliO